MIPGYFSSNVIADVLLVLYTLALVILTVWKFAACVATTLPLLRLHSCVNYLYLL